jgi:hypothetical protein
VYEPAAAAAILLTLAAPTLAQTYTPPRTRRPRAHRHRETGRYRRVKDFGARGDGVADDTAAMRRAIDAARAAGRSLFVPAGNYLIRGLTLSGGVDIFAFRNNLFSGAASTAIFGDSPLIRAFSEDDLTDPFAPTIPVFSDGLSGTSLSGVLQLGHSEDTGECVKSASYAWVAIC